MSEYCQSMITATLTGRKCRKPAVPDWEEQGALHPMCERHLAIFFAEKGKRGCYMSRFYLKTLRPTLAALIESQLDESEPMQALSGLEELALIRTSAADVVQLYDQLVESNAPAEAKIEAGLIMTSRLREVLGAAQQASNIEEVKSRLRGALANGLSQTITSVMKAAWETFGDNVKMKDFEQNLRDQMAQRNLGVPLGTDGSGGTSLTPDQDAMDMDASVPRSPDEVTAGEDTSS